MTGAGKRDADSWPPMVLLVKETKPDDNRVDMCVVVAWGSSMRDPAHTVRDTRCCADALGARQSQGGDAIMRLPQLVASTGVDS